MSGALLRRLIPRSVRHRRPVRWIRDLIAIPQWVPVLWSGPCPRGEISVFYGHTKIPRRTEQSQGGIVKLQWMQEAFPNCPSGFNVLYMVSSRIPTGALPMAWIARRKGARLVWNQDGVAYPAWHGPGWEGLNGLMRELLHAADHVFYQSRFAKEGADRYLGERRGPWEILYNSVETRIFIPATSDPDPRHLVVLCIGTVLSYYRLASALETLAHVARERSDVRMCIAGRLAWIPDEARALAIAQALARELGVEERVRFLGTFTQEEAPAIYRRAHLLLHTTYNDPCPTVVLEAMACGLPVVYSVSGGVPELVGPDAGIGVPSGLDWERELPPDPEMLARAVLEVAARRQEFARAARQRVVERFDIRPWIQRHREVFRGMVA